MTQTGRPADGISERHTNPTSIRFSIRDRIVAGISDATIVTETGVKGGSMITADLANGYHKEVFTFPGRTTDVKSAGCHWLIRNNQAGLISNAQELIPQHGMGGKKTGTRLTRFSRIYLFPSANMKQKIVSLLKERESMHIEVINAISGFTQSLNAATLLSLEMKDMIQSLPGRIYKSRN